MLKFLWEIDGRLKTRYSRKEYYKVFPVQQRERPRCLTTGRHLDFPYLWWRRATETGVPCGTAPQSQRAACWARACPDLACSRRARPARTNPAHELHCLSSRPPFPLILAGRWKALLLTGNLMPKQKRFVSRASGTQACCFHVLALSLPGGRAAAEPLPLRKGLGADALGVPAVGPGGREAQRLGRIRARSGTTAWLWCGSSSALQGCFDRKVRLF